ncbi:hypothetical protein Nhal_1575 [Nitrosococcus halophilus Nc 4]|uniref:Uncharacterized protein n=1 Tax=Nitrosococcus halophilus (strain Nc4) TaxID=472759 RepID=D5C1S9_NITHN|nr:hypothetical protein Nhal_1575 [Nitrosococcus halophilus Nc 4]
MNLVAAIYSVYPGWQLIFPLLGSAGCVIAAAALVNQLLLNDPQYFWKISGAAAVLLVFRFVYLYWHRSKLPLPPSIWKRTPPEAQILILSQLRRLGELEKEEKKLKAQLKRNSNN